MGVVNAILWDNDKHLIGSVQHSGEAFWRLAVDTGGSSGAPNQASFFVGQRNVTTPGTAVQLLAQAIPSGFALVIKAKDGNTGSIWVGTTAAEAQDHTTAFELSASQVLRLFITNANLVFIDADVAGEGVNLAVEEA